MALRHYIHRALSLPPHQVALRVLQLLSFQFKSYFIEFKDITYSTYSKQISTDFQTVFPKAPDSKKTMDLFPQLDLLIKKTLNHEFDLLGSGWTQVKHEKAFTTPEVNSGNLKNSLSIWNLVSDNYSPIDWHLDFKSNYRWNPKTWWFRVPYGHVKGVDIKVPWELSRAHHLSWLALGYGKDRDAKCAEEVRNQILDFIANNPPKFGVNWRCPMDVAIRSANWILAYEWLRLYGWKADEKFKSALANSLYDHGDFVYKHLERGSDGFRGNHFLADVCGLIFISEFLSLSSEVKKWRDFAFEALKEEMDYQFFHEGSNFEGSTSYHRLSSEMMLYSTIAVLLKGRERFSNAYLERLYEMSIFSKDVTRPDGDIVQIGDCDSGRFFKIQPLFRKDLEEHHLTHRCLIEGIESLFRENATPQTVEGQWIQDLNLSVYIPKLSSYHVPHSNSVIKAELPDFIFQWVQSLNSPSDTEFKSLDYPYQIGSIAFTDQKMDLIPYPEFGLYLWKSQDYFLSFRCGNVGQKLRGGHDHNDQLSIEVYSKGTLIKYDPGTAIYTPYPDVRNKYRSAKAHTGPLVQKESGEIIEPGPLNQGLFSMNGGQNGFILAATESTFAGYQPAIKTVRILKRHGPSIDVIDICLEKSWKIVPSEAQPPMSKGYGLY